jgi:hypothetical protein
MEWGEWGKTKSFDIFCQLHYSLHLLGKMPLSRHLCILGAILVYCLY